MHSELPVRDAVSLGTWFLKFQGITLPSSSGPSSPDCSPLHMKAPGTTHPMTELHVPAGCAKCRCDSYLLLGQLLAASHLADLMALVVPTRSAISTVILALTACAFATSLAFLLDGLLAFTIRDGGSVGTRLKGRLKSGCARHSRHLSRAFYAAASSSITLCRALQ